MHRIDELLVQQNQLKSQLIRLKTLLSSDPADNKITGNDIDALFRMLFSCLIGDRLLMLIWLFAAVSKMSFCFMYLLCTISVSSK